jgi:hypothetical protein
MRRPATIAAMLKRLVRALAFALALSPALSPARAATPVEEIDHLLAFIAGSSCVFIRNGAEYRGPDAADHIRKKYDHFRDEIASAEDFIRLSATKSELSGRPYDVRCGSDAAIPAAEWLRMELAAFRKDAS